MGGCGYEFEDEHQRSRRITSKYFSSPEEEVKDNTKKEEEEEEEGGTQSRCDLPFPPPPPTESSALSGGGGSRQYSLEEKMKPGGFHSPITHSPTAASLQSEQLPKKRKRRTNNDGEQEKKQRVPSPASVKALEFIASCAYTGKGVHARSTISSSTTGTTTALSINKKAAAGTKISRKPKSPGAGWTIQKERKKRATLKAKDRFKDAYKRVAKDHPWVPPKSPHGLLQEAYHDDHWKVLIICILCNRTRGRQAETVLERLFKVCSSPRRTSEIPEETIEKIIQPLGLQTTRANNIRKMAIKYLGDWAYVTELPGIGKYAADAYAIFCSGRWKEVEPVDYMLEHYWNFLHDWEKQKIMV